MVGVLQARWFTFLLAALAVVAAVGVGVKLRLDDPLSTPVIPAEDPYTHMALTREHLRDGNLDPLNAGGGLYPPGLHGFLAAAWVYTGADLYEIVRLGPVLFGAIGILGIAILLWRSDGPVAGIVGAFALAMAPEAIFRTTMMSPTALDLALLPFLLFALLEVMRGRLWWAGAAAPMAMFLVFAHPWLITVLGFTGVGFAVFALTMRWPTTRASSITPKGLAWAVAIIGFAWGLSLTGCGGRCGPGFSGIFPGGEKLSVLAPVILLASLTPIVLLYLKPDRFDRWLLRTDPKPMPFMTKLAISTVLAALVAITTIPAMQDGLPEYVDLPPMFGWPVLILAVFAFVLLPWYASPAAHMGAALAATTYPFVMYNPLHSPYWPHRTAVYFGIGLALLAGVAAAGIARSVSQALRDRSTAPSTTSLRRARPVFAAIAVFLVAGSASGAVYAGAPNLYPGGWDRLFGPCEFQGLRHLADEANENPDAILITGDWQSKLVLAALVTNATRVWYKSDFFTDAEGRDNFIVHIIRQETPLYVVVTRYIDDETPQADTTFLQQDPWENLGESCAEDEAVQDRPFGLYALQGTRP